MDVGGMSLLSNTRVVYESPRCPYCHTPLDVQQSAYDLGVTVRHGLIERELSMRVLAHSSNPRVIVEMIYGWCAWLHSPRPVDPAPRLPKPPGPGQRKYHRPRLLRGR